MAAGMESMLNEAGLDPHSDWRNIQPGKLVQESKTTQIYRVPFDGGCFYFKRYRLPSHKTWRYFLRPSKAAGEWFGLEAFRKIGIEAAQVVSFGEERILGRLDKAYIVTLGINDAVNMEDFASDTWQSMPGPEKDRVYRSIRSKLFDQIQLAHRHGLFHRDLHWRNILLYPDSQGGYDTCWIDCPRAVRRRLFQKYYRMTDLSCLSRLALNYLNRSERYRALALFIEGEPVSNVRKLFRQIERHHRSLKFPIRTVVTKVTDKSSESRLNG